MKVHHVCFAVCLLLSGCGNREYSVEEIDNPLYKPNVEFRGFEDLSHPGFQHLIEKYQLDTIFHGETDEFKRILLLRQWIKSVIKIDDHGDPYPGGNAAEGILDEALQGQGDAKYDHHFEKDGIPLSALEIRDEYLKNKAADIIKVKGPDRTPTDKDPETGTSKERSAQTYTWIEFHTNNDMFTVWPNHETLLSMYEDEYFKNHTWIWGDGPHWAYAQPDFMRRVKERDAIEWTPNIIASEVNIEGEIASISLVSETANLKEYQMKEQASGDWEKVDDLVSIELSKKRHELSFRTVNILGIAGPEHKIVISAK